MGRMTTHILWKIKNVPNQQPVYNYIIPCHSPVIYRISPQLHVFFYPPILTGMQENVQETTFLR